MGRDVPGACLPAQLKGCPFPTSLHESNVVVPLHVHDNYRDMQLFLASRLKSSGMLAPTAKYTSARLVSA